MAKKLYSVPLKKVLLLTKEKKSEFFRLVRERIFLELNKLYGKSYYLLEIEEFMRFFGIDRDNKYALQTIENFNSKTFIDEIALRLNFSAYELEKNKISKKDFFYAYLYLLKIFDSELFSNFLQKLFLHYHSSYKAPSSININFKEMAIGLAKFKKVIIKESFGENENGAYYKILFADKIIAKSGKSIKTLRKQAYKELFYALLDL